MTFLGMTSSIPFDEHLTDILMTLHEKTYDRNDREIFVYEKIYLKDLVYLLYSSVFLSNEDQKLISQEFINYILDNSFKLNGKEKEILGSALRGLGSHSEAQKILRGTQSSTVSFQQNEITKRVRNWINLHFKSKLFVISEADVKGRKVDILITGFRKMGMKQWDIVIEVDGNYHFACNNLDHELGTNFVRNKGITNLGLELRTFHLKTGLDNAIAEVLDYLDMKWERYWKKSVLKNQKKEP